MLCSKIVFKTELPLNLLFWSDDESYFKGKVTSLPRSLFCAIIVPQQTFLASRIRISNKTLFWFSVGIHCSMVDSQVVFLSHGVWLVVSFLVVWLVLHYRVCSIFDKIFELVLLSIIHLNPCFFHKESSSEETPDEESSEDDKQEVCYKKFLSTALIGIHSPNCTRVNAVYAWNTLKQYTVNSVEGDHPWCTTKWLLKGGGRLQEKSRKYAQTELYNVIT